MIFEAKKNDIRKAFGMIEKMLTSKESKDDEYGTFTMIAEKEKVVFVGDSEDFPVMTFVSNANVITAGEITVSLEEITSVFKASFKKNVLLTLESEEEFLKIDDGFYEPQRIQRVNEYEKSGFSISSNKLFSINKEVLHNSIYECAVAVKKTYLKGTSYLQVNVDNSIEFCATSLHQVIQKTVSANIDNKSLFYIEKEVVARMIRLLKEDKSKEIECFLSDNEIHISTTMMQFKVPIEIAIAFPKVKEILTLITSKDIYPMCKKDVMSRMGDIDAYYKEKGIKDTKDTHLLITLNEPFEIVPDAPKEEDEFCEGLIPKVRTIFLGESMMNESEQSVEDEQHIEVDSETPSKMQLTEEKVNALLPGNIGIFHPEEVVFVSNCTILKYGLFKSIVKGIKEEVLSIYNTDSIGCVKEPLIIEYQHEQNGHYQSLIMPVVKR
ncbi:MULTISPECIES: hypothetical protein [Bacillus]|uniref:DNA polymerase III subunit beta n=2 Tax=Bacillus thuringiensis TaxID=1428 RepID=A0AAP4V285_BACTU|nr:MULTISPECIES: hypothetical protein [Bacillus]MEC0046482.1 hypothetical protein [Bacillus cereus]AFV21848.1 hypothetical protein BTB_502p05430 [Bacillus thuringiensis Bt407]EEM25127.1 hypothetical protein bthur0002_57690 [Bacillus thuringiensis Bt407]ERI00975.1 hypothetical protein BTCBT_002530 [Bacillus thuringiensis T01-328]MBN6707739.1 hypothetical protein [Bacillus thuringiensis]